MSCFTGGLVTWFLQHPNVFKVQMHSIQKCKINSKAKELKLNVVSVKLAQYLDNIICNQNQNEINPTLYYKTINIPT